VAFGLGDVLVEVLKDVTFRMAPATRQDALSMLDSFPAEGMLQGVRHRRRFQLQAEGGQASPRGYPQRSSSRQDRTQQDD
jgi:hypothetical protein